jgi:hypothetical protein
MSRCSVAGSLERRRPFESRADHRHAGGPFWSSSLNSVGVCPDGVGWSASRIVSRFSACRSPSQRPYDLQQEFPGLVDWGEVFNDHVLATTIFDRLLHHATPLNIRGESYRLKEKRKAGLIGKPRPMDDDEMEVSVESQTMIPEDISADDQRTFWPDEKRTFSTDVDVVDVEVTNTIDRGQMAPMVRQLEQRCGQAPQEHIVDDAFVTLQDLVTVSAPHGQTVVYAPASSSWNDREVDLAEGSERGSPAILTWQQRMKTPEAREIYKERLYTVEWVNALIRNRGLIQFPVRGLKKAKSVLLWYALLHNLLIGHALRIKAKHRGLAGMM